jgi:hypothetical protein
LLLYSCNMIPPEMGSDFCQEIINKDIKPNLEGIFRLTTVLVSV